MSQRGSIFSLRQVHECDQWHVATGAVTLSTAAPAGGHRRATSTLQDTVTASYNGVNKTASVTATS